jgi:hypothetical protein
LYFQNATECTILPPSEKQFSEGRPLPLLVSRGLACMQCFLFADDFIGAKNKADIPDGNEYIIRKWLVLKLHGSGHLPNHTTSK